MPEVVKAPLRAVYQLWARSSRPARRLLARPDPVQLVVCGYPRSGTSLLYNMLSSSLAGMHFTEFEEPARNSLQLGGSWASKFPLDVLDVSGFDGLNIFGKRIIVLILIRDPRDILVSRHPLLPGEYFIGYDHSWWPGRIGSGSWTYSAPGIGAIHTAIGRAEECRSVQSIRVRYEALTADPDQVQREIAARTGLEFSDAFSRFHDHQDRHAYRYEGRRAPKDPTLALENRAIDMSRAGRWTRPEHRDRLVDQFTRFPELLEIVRSYGYATDDAWFSDLLSGEPVVDGCRPA